MLDETACACGVGITLPLVASGFALSLRRVACGEGIVATLVVSGFAGWLKHHEKRQQFLNQFHIEEVLFSVGFAVLATGSLLAVKRTEAKLF